MKSFIERVIQVLVEMRLDEGEVKSLNKQKRKVYQSIKGAFRRNSGDGGKSNLQVGRDIDKNISRDSITRAGDLRRSGDKRRARNALSDKDKKPQLP